MKVIEIPFCFYPDPVGGTEIYVESLSLNLQRQGLEVVIAAPASGSREGTYQHKGLRVRRFATAERLDDLRALYGDGDECAAAAYVRILEEERPDLVHLHAFTSACSLRLVRETRRRRIPLLFTYHTPTVSCQRGTLMRWGSDVCDGRLDLRLCTSCTLHGLGVRRGLANVVGRVPVFVGTVLGSARLSGGGWTALRMRELVHARQVAFRTLMTEVDHVVAVSDWVRDLLLANGIPPGKITLSRQGLPERAGSREQRARSEEEGGTNRELKAPSSLLPAPCSHIRIAFFGRLDSTKGAHIFIQALRSVPDLPVTLDVYGVVPDRANGATYLESLQLLAGDDRRVTFHAPVSSGEVVGCLQGYDMLAVPSQLLETGPLVVLEAFAAGVPVLGSRLGGIAELVEHDVNGLLVEPGLLDGWCQAIRRVSKDRALLTRLRTGIRSPREMTEVAAEMVRLYHDVKEKGYGVKPQYFVRSLGGSRAAVLKKKGNRRVLYVQYTNPAGYPPLEHSSRILAGLGWEVLFLGTGAAGDANRLRFPPHTDIIVRQLPFCPPGFLQKLHYFWFSLWVLGWTLRWRPQWIYASDPLVCPIALLLSFLPHVQIIYHEHDSPTESWGSLFVRLCLRARQKLARRAKICVLPNQQRAGRFSREAAGGRRVLCVWNCPQKEEVRPPRSPRTGDRMIVYYHGVVGAAYVPPSLLQAMAVLSRGIHLRVIGYETVGTQGYLDYLRRESRRLGVENRLELLGPMPRSEALAQCSQCDVGLALISSKSRDVNNVYKIGASNRAFDYLACGLALLVSDLPDWHKMYAEAGYGLACDPEDPESIALALRWFFEHPVKMRAMGEKGRQRILAEWNYETQFSPLLGQLSGGDG